MLCSSCPMRIPGPPLFFFCWHQLEYFLYITFIEVCYKNTRIWIYKLFLACKTLHPFGRSDIFRKNQNWALWIMWSEKDPKGLKFSLKDMLGFVFAPFSLFLSHVFLPGPFSSHSDCFYERCHFQENFVNTLLIHWVDDRVMGQFDI